MNQPKRILICPLDWGLGHATRCIPIIRLLLQKKAEVIIAAGGRPLELLKQEFPQLKCIVFKGYEIEYPRSGSMAFKMLLDMPRIFKKIRQEHEQLETLIDEYKIDIVISDNRYGCWSKKVKSIFITHQLMVKAPAFEMLAHKKILRYIKKYDECWVPDAAGNTNLSGDLSHKFPLPDHACFIGTLSRFEKKSTVEHPEYDVMAIISGPEPQRSIFERLVSQQLFKSHLKALIIFGLPEGKQKTESKGNITMISHLNATQMQDAILKSGIIIARSGYSTIMDLAALGKKAVFVPTPGQTEQEYLAGVLKAKKVAYSVKQEEFDLVEALKVSTAFSGFGEQNNGGDLEKRVSALLGA